MARLICDPGTPALAKFLLDLGYNTGEFGKNHLGDHTEALPTAHPGILGLPLSPRCEAAGELHRHQQESNDAGRRAAVQEHADPRRAGSTPCCGFGDRGLPDASTPRSGVQVFRRHGEEPDA
jgi:arylsulfatase A-like enzyme